MLRLTIKGISFRDKSRLFTSNFLKALGIACFIHLAGLVIFQIHPYLIRNAAPLFPPVQLKVEQLLSTSEIYAELKEKDHFHLTINEPEWRIPSFPNLIEPLIAKERAYPKLYTLPEDTFFPLIDWVSEPVWPEEVVSPKPALEIAISGPLGERSYDFQTEPLTTPGNYRIVYSVKVDNKTGQIFWSDCHTSDFKKKIKAHADKILDQMTFESTSGFETEGLIEITYSS